MSSKPIDSIDPLLNTKSTQHDTTVNKKKRSHTEMTTEKISNEKFNTGGTSSNNLTTSVKRVKIPTIDLDRPIKIIMPQNFKTEKNSSGNDETLKIDKLNIEQPSVIKKTEEEESTVQQHENSESESEEGESTLQLLWVSEDGKGISVSYENSESEAESE